MAKTRQYRFVSDDFEAQEDSYIVQGYATTFDEPYQLGFEDYNECVLRSALEEADMSDVVFRYDHTGMVLARQRNNTLKIELDDHGMLVTADLGGCEQGRNLYEGIKNGLIDRMSWAFITADEGYKFDKDTNTFTITRVAKVFDVAAVGIPADDATEISARYLDGAIERIREQEVFQRIERQRKAAKAKFLVQTGVRNG